MPSQAFLSLTQQVRIPLCSRRYQINRMIHEFLQCTHIFSGIFRQILQLLQAEISHPQPGSSSITGSASSSLLSVGKNPTAHRADGIP